MSSLYSRANARQIRILRAVEGAVHNVAHAHPGWISNRLAARSIAKRAAGTLTAIWPEVLAAPLLASSDLTEGKPSHPLSRVRCGSTSAARGASQPRKATPYRRLIREISQRIGPAKRAGQIERAETLIEVLRVIDGLR